MKLKTLESSIADRVNELTASKPTDRDALVNHLTILDRAAADLKDDGTLLNAIIQATAAFDIDEEPVARRVIAALAASNDPARAVRAA